MGKKAVAIESSVNREKHQSRIQPALGRVPTSGKRFAVDLPRSKILSTRLLFRAGPKVKKNWSETARVQNTRALTDVRLRRRTSRARTRSARLRPRADPSARRWNQTPADRRPSQRPRRRSFFTSTRHDAGARPDGPRDRPHARARARERHGDTPCGRRTDRAGAADPALRVPAGPREARANSAAQNPIVRVPRHSRLTVRARTNNGVVVVARDFRELTDAL